LPVDNAAVRRALRALTWCSLLLGLWGFVVEPSLLVVHRSDVRLPAWPRPLRLLVLADIHAGSPWNWTGNLRRVVDRANRERPDLVVLLGDYVIQGVPPEIAVLEIRGTGRPTTFHSPGP
jgi:predicted MPP superfamily phosphohydrolase